MRPAVFCCLQPACSLRAGPAMPGRSILLLPVIVASLSASAPAAIKVVDPAGRPVEHFEVMWHTEHDGYGRWEAGTNGEADSSHFQYVKAPAIDLIVRSKDFATTVERFEGDRRKDLRTGTVTMTLQPGREVVLRLNAA